MRLPMDAMSERIMLLPLLGSSSCKTHASPGRFPSRNPRRHCKASSINFKCAMACCRAGSHHSHVRAERPTFKAVIHWPCTRASSVSRASLRSPGMTGLRSHQRVALHALQNLERRKLWTRHCVRVEVKRLLEHILSGQRGVHDLIGKTEPCRSWRELHFDLRTGFLVALVELGIVMEPEHEVVVGAAASLGDTGSCKQPGPNG